MIKDTLHIVSFSGGKDSTAMLLMMLERGMQVDEIIFCDTGKEFPEMYEHIDAVEEYIGRPITRLKADKSWEYFMFDHERTKGKNKGMKGYGWALPQIRWCTGHMKKKVFDKYVKRKGVPYITYIGIAYDEPQRHERKEENTIHPLYDWQITEKEALDYCYSKGFDWGGFTRSSAEYLVGVAR